jgi:hypothetical protein
MEKFMKYAAEIGSGAMIYIPSVLKTDSDFRMPRGIHIHTESMVIS